jgi:hypothetical protein
MVRCLAACALAVACGSSQAREPAPRPRPPAPVPAAAAPVDAIADAVRVLEAMRCQMVDKLSPGVALELRVRRELGPLPARDAYERAADRILRSTPRRSCLQADGSRPPRPSDAELAHLLASLASIQEPPFGPSTGDAFEVAELLAGRPPGVDAALDPARYPAFVGILARAGFDAVAMGRARCLRQGGSDYAVIEHALAHRAKHGVFPTAIPLAWRSDWDREVFDVSIARRTAAHFVVRFVSRLDPSRGTVAELDETGTTRFVERRCSLLPPGVPVEVPEPPPSPLPADLAAAWGAILGVLADEWLPLWEPVAYQLQLRWPEAFASWPKPAKLRVRRPLAELDVDDTSLHALLDLFAQLGLRVFSRRELPPWDHEDREHARGEDLAAWLVAMLLTHPMSDADMRDPARLREAAETLRAARVGLTAIKTVRCTAARRAELAVYHGLPCVLQGDCRDPSPGATLATVLGSLRSPRYRHEHARGRITRIIGIAPPVIGDEFVVRDGELFHETVECDLSAAP